MSNTKSQDPPTLPLLGVEAWGSAWNKRERMNDKTRHDEGSVGSPTKVCWLRSQEKGKQSNDEGSVGILTLSVFSGSLQTDFECCLRLVAHTSFFLTFVKYSHTNCRNRKCPFFLSFRESPPTQPKESNPFLPQLIPLNYTWLITSLNSISSWCQCL